MHITLKHIQKKTNSKFDYNTLGVYSFVCKKMPKSWVKKTYGIQCDDEYYFTRKTRNNPYGRTWITKHHDRYGGYTWEITQVDTNVEKIPYVFGAKYVECY